MTLNLRIFRNMLKQGIQSMWRNKSMGVASITSIAAVLMILGIVLVLILSINNVVNDTKLKFDEIEVFLEDEISSEQMSKIEDTAKDVPGVVSVIYRSKEQALELMKEDWGEDAYLLEDLETNPLPNSYIIKVEDIELADNLVNSIKTLDGVEEVKYYKDIIDKLLNFASYIRIGGMIIIAVLVFVSIFIISNTIKLTVTSRKREINIMKYVGATNSYIRGPFIIEGVFFGLVGAIISIAVVYFAYRYLYLNMNESFYNMFTFYLIPPESIISDISVIFLTLGAGIGAMGSMLSLKKFLNV
ncbi:ABC transporter permease [Soehngenia longivitae]|uniref:Cell division protein FtsX n=1 Tax=Soehngenia longivitae TaxID=2562294 RepID=A0A4Z0D693_9FIRM|nr:permease-like cell division protein FtsX [Soehngenia longivitae]TFZ40384.1 ABC transporter permease [Soehngenia longivitae]